MNLTEQQALLIIARHEWPDGNCRIQTFSDGHCVIDLGDPASTDYKGSVDLKLDHNTVEPIWNEWLDRVVEWKETKFIKSMVPCLSAELFAWLMIIRTPLDKANALIEYWLAAGEITEEDLK